MDLPRGGFVPIAIETNGLGFIGHLVELPGAFVRGRNEPEALDKVPREARSYLGWLGVIAESNIQGRIVERHHCRLMVEDADSEILLTADRSPASREEFRRLAEITRRSCTTFNSLYDSSELKDWVDSSRVRTTFYGDVPKTIQETFDHVERTQHYYLSRVGLAADRKQSLVDVRESGLKQIERKFEREGNLEVYDVDGEQWTLKKVLRRFVLHDRIHGKAMTRILAKQRRLGLIESFEDSFHFGL